MLRRKLFYPLYCSAARNPTLFSSFDSPHGNPPDIVDYLIKSVGLSPDAAVKSSKSLSSLKSLSRPDAVLRFFKESGFSDAHIKCIVSKNSSLLLTTNVDTTLRPKIIAMKEFDFSESEIHHLVSTNPFCLSLCNHAKIEFWKNFLGSKRKLFNALIRSRGLFGSNLDTNIMPKISFLRGIGNSNHLIASMISSHPNFILRNLDSIKRLSKQVEGMGFSYGSRSFCVMLISLCQISTETLDSKMKLLRSFGWSEAEALLAFRKVPRLLETSEKKMKVTMEFLVNQAGAAPSYVMKCPKLLMLSLERRMIPRNHVVRLLETKGLLKKIPSLFSFMTISEKKFMEKYVFPCQEKMPELLQAYLALCAGNSTRV